MANEAVQQRAHNFKDLTGQRFGRLRVLRYLHTKKKRPYWECLCDCGRGKVVSGGALRLGVTSSCGCLRAEQLAARSTTHGATRGSSRYTARPTEYIAWAHIVQRCTNPNNRAWKNYGGRGITVCTEWRISFEAFLAHVGPKPAPGLSIERINNSLGYEPGNVKWATHSEQMRNRRKFIHLKKKTHCPAGHPYDDANTYWLKNGSRRCLICKRRHGLETDRRRKQKRTDD